MSLITIPSNTNEAVLLIYGYKRQIEKNLNIIIANGIFGIIKIYYPIFNVFAIGRNDSGQFGLGHRRMLNKFKLLPTFSALISNVNNIYCNKERFFIKTLDNELFGCGTNILGQCGLSLSQRRYTRFKQLDIPTNDTSSQSNDDNIIISCGVFNRHTFISITDKLYGCGTNSSGAFGNNCKTDEYHRNKLQLIQINDLIMMTKMKKIVCSDQHSLFLCDDGRLFGCGDNEYGTAGLGEDIVDVLVPTQIIKGHNIIDIDAGMWHNLCIDSLYNVWVFGANFFGQIGLPQHEEYLCFEPRINKYFNDNDMNICKVYCGTTHSLCMDINGNIYLFGQSSNGQIGNGIDNDRNMVVNDSNDGVFEPYCFQSNKKFKDTKIIDASCGANHNVMLSNKNEIIVFGDNKYKQCSINLFKKDVKIVNDPYVLCKKKDIGLINENVFIEKVLAETNSTLIIVAPFKKWIH